LPLTLLAYQALANKRELSKSESVCSFVEKVLRVKASLRAAYHLEEQTVKVHVSITEELEKDDQTTLFRSTWRSGSKITADEVVEDLLGKVERRARGRRRWEGKDSLCVKLTSTATTSCLYGHSALLKCHSIKVGHHWENTSLVKARLVEEITEHRRRIEQEGLIKAVLESERRCPRNH